MDPEVTVGSIVRAVRRAKGISARDLSLQAGLSESYVGKLESGSLEPSLSAFARIATELHLTPAEIHTIVLLQAHQTRGSRGPHDD